MYSISQIASELAIKPHTLRYYEAEGIVVPYRNEQGERRYKEEHLQWLRFIIKLRESRMPIADIKQYVKLLNEGEHTTNERLKLLEDHKRSIQQQREELEATEKMIEKKVQTYKKMIGVI